MPSKAPRNKTISLSKIELALYASQAIFKKKKYEISELENQLVFGDSFEVLKAIPENSVDLIIVDPPYNLTKTFSKTIFKKTHLDSYKKWLDDWLKLCAPLLKETGSLYICSDWYTSISIPEVAMKYFVLQNRISWGREKGRGAKNNWKNCLEDIWFFSKSEEYYYDVDAVKMQKTVLAPYKDKQGNPKDWQEVDNKQKIRDTHPSNFWTDISIPFWSMKENTEHPTQKPEKLIAKLILASSKKGDIVLDPFLGSGTTAVVAKKLGRKYIGIEREKEYVALANKRLEMADSDKSIQGFEDGVFKHRNG